MTSVVLRGSAIAPKRLSLGELRAWHESEEFQQSSIPADIQDDYDPSGMESSKSSGGNMWHSLRFTTLS
jgi:hypothetical protein